MDLLTVKETAALLKVSPLTVRRYIAGGRLPAVRMGRRLRIERRAVARLLAPVDSPATVEQQVSLAGTPTSDEDPFWDIVGIGDAPEVADMSADKYRYLAEVASDNLR